MNTRNDARTYCEISLDAISHNIQSIKNTIAENVKIMGVVKADAYGHGAVKISEVLINNGVEYLAVATLEEALEVRNVFSDIPILVLGFIPENNIEIAIRENITQTIYNMTVAKQVSDCAEKINLKAKVHIKVDTGMNRIGFWGSQLREMYELKNYRSLEIEGIYTHFSCADTDYDYTEKQFSRFMIVCEKMHQNGFEIKYRHCCNSSALINFPQMHLDMVRPGILIYGQEPHRGIDKSKICVKPAMSFKTKVTHLKKVPAGSKISYGGVFITNEDCMIATIPVGYADGYSRRLSNNIDVLIHDQYAKVLGRICMDQCMIDVTHLKDVNVLDEVVLFGRQGNNEITVDEIADKLNTINYEVICSIGKRVPRIYI